MATTDFSVKATNIDEVPNFVSVKEGISDPSISTAMEGVAKGIRGAAQVYGTMKSRAGYQEMESAMLEELTATASTESLKEFAGSVEKVNQLLSLGRADRAELRLDAELRKRVRAEPLLAGRYRAIHDRLKGEYAKTLGMIRAIENEANAAKNAAMQGLISTSQSYIQKGIPVLDDNGNVISPYVATEAQLIRHHAVAGGEISFQQAAAEARAVRQEERAEAAEERSIAGESRSVTEFENRLLDRKNEFALGQALANSANMVNLLIDSGLDSGEAYINPAEWERNVTEAATAIRAKLFKDLQQLPLTPSQIAAATSNINAQFDAMSQFVGEGKYASLARQSRIIETLRGKHQLDFQRAAPAMAALLDALPPSLLANSEILGVLGITSKTAGGLANIFKNGLTNVNTEFSRQTSDFLDVLEGRKKASDAQVGGVLRLTSKLNEGGDALPNPSNYANLLRESADNIGRVDAGERAALYVQLTQGAAMDRIAQIPEGADRDSAIESYRKILQAQAADYLMYNNIDPKGFVFNTELEAFEGTSANQKRAADDINTLFARARQASDKSSKAPELTDLAVQLVPMAWGNIKQPKEEGSMSPKSDTSD